ncbi:MAG: DUF2059 domain-containing protein [Flavobacteriaceae bacterium]|jgi:hypothetical protein|tara:strand:- start:447 stop:851 length:405 start_codon:yes stop_codon:yes gene_type:complete
MKKIFITLLLLISFNSLSSQDNYKSLLIDYMTAQGQFETFNATIDQMGSMMGVTIKESDKEEFTKDVMGSLIDLLVPVYKKHFSEQDLKDAIEMYKTPIGKKISEKTPIIAQETMQASMQWGMELSQKMQKYIQ